MVTRHTETYHRPAAGKPAAHEAAPFEPVQQSAAVQAKRADGKPDDLKEVATPVINQANRAADKHDGTLHDPVNWNGQIVEYVGDVGTSDPEYSGDHQQCRIITADGKPMVIPKHEIMRETTPAHRTFAPDRVGGSMTAEEANRKK